MVTIVYDFVCSCSSGIMTKSKERNFTLTKSFTTRIMADHKSPKSYRSLGAEILKRLKNFFKNMYVCTNSGIIHHVLRHKFLFSAVPLEHTNVEMECNTRNICLFS